MKLKSEGLKISVMIPTYNMANTIQETLKSVLNQTYNNFEIIIQDNNSQDNTYKIIKSFSDSRIKYFKNDINIGYARNLIAGKKIAKETFSTFSELMIFFQIMRFLIRVMLLWWIMKLEPLPDLIFGFKTILTSP